MHMDRLAAPFGGRPMSLGLIATQARAASIPDDRIAHKWRLLRALSLARQRFGLADRAVALLEALLSFHPDTTLTPGRHLVVFPSNRELSLRARGMAISTLQRHLASLIDAGLLIRRDSPNGKRYARKGHGGEIAEAYGFDLSPLLARLPEIEAAAEAVEAERRDVARLRERITIDRRDIGKTLEALIGEGVSGPWATLAARHRALSGRLRRIEPAAELAALAAALAELRADIDKTLETLVFSKESRGSDSRSDIDIQNSNKEPSDSELAVKEARAPASDAGKPSARVQAYPLGFVLGVCPDLQDWSKTPIRDWSAFVATAALVRTALGISPSAYEEARGALGDIPAAIVIAILLQKGEAVKSPGGYLRSLTAKARDGTFSLGPPLMALQAARLKGRGGRP